MNPTPPFFLLFLKCIVLATSRLKKIEEYHVTKVNFTTDGVFPLCAVFPYISYSILFLYSYTRKQQWVIYTPIYHMCFMSDVIQSFSY